MRVWSVNRRLASVALAGLLALAASVPSRAAIVLTVSVSDGTNVLDTASLSVANLYSVTQASFLDLSNNEVFANDGVTFGLSGNSNTPGSSSVAKLLSNEVSVSNTSAGTRIITVTAAATPFNAPGQAGDTMQLQSTITSSKDPGAIAFQSFYDPDAASGLTGTGVQNPPSIVLGDNLYSSFVRGNTFILENVTTITLTSGVSAQSNGTTKATGPVTQQGPVPAPEPATLALAAAGLPLLAARRWLRRSRSA